MKKLIFFSILFALIASGCEFESYKEYETDAYEGALTFTQVNKKADWKNRYGHAAVAYKDKLWVLGGYNPGEVKNDTYYEDVWSSEDGLTWELITDNAPWHGRKGHRVVTFDDGTGEAMFLVGGFSVNEETGFRQYNNDVWKSTDGLNWTELKTTIDTNRLNLGTFMPRMDHALVVANHGGQDYMFVIGGRSQLTDVTAPYNQPYFHDVWRSADGIVWDSLSNNDYGERAGHAAAVDEETGMIYIQGGQHSTNFEIEENAYHPSDDWGYVWSSPDGITWTSESKEGFAEANFARVDHNMIFYKNTIWTFSGRSDSRMHYQFTYTHNYTIWNMNMVDTTWNVEFGSPYYGRHSYATAVKDDKIWIMGGFTSDMGQDNDVWTAEL